MGSQLASGKTEMEGVPLEAGALAVRERRVFMLTRLSGAVF
jgi:hypothetical protein